MDQRKDGISYTHSAEESIRARVFTELDLIRDAYMRVGKTIPDAEFDLWVKVHMALEDLAEYYEEQGFPSFKH